MLNALIQKTFSQPSRKWISTSIALLTSSQNLTDHFCIETDKAWSLSCCSACFGVEAKLVATEFEVPRRRAPTMFGATICHYTICRCCFQQTGSCLKLAEELAGACPLWQSQKRNRWGWTCSRWCGYIWRLKLFPPFFWGRSQYIWTAR